jgi:hypothetical protein
VLTHLFDFFLVDCAVVVGIKTSKEASHPLGNFVFAKLAVLVAVKTH